MPDKMDTLEGFYNKLGFRISHLQEQIRDWQREIVRAEREIRKLEHERIVITTVMRDVKQVKETMDGQKF